MRKIKFRMWACEAEQMCSWESLLNQDDKCCENTNGMPIGPTIGQCLGGYTDDVEVMQYTGCEDSEGTEMYEGDIIFGDRVVKYDCMSFYHEAPNGDKCMFGGWYDQTRCTIIGNIYENPELVDWEECPECNNKPRKKKKCPTCCHKGYLIKEVKK